MNKIVIFGFALILIVAGMLVFSPKPSISMPATPSATTTPSTSTTSFTPTEVAKHSTAESCYTSINGSVYDVTKWIAAHPGGSQAILSLCGIDGSTAFNDQHGGQPRPANELTNFKIGILTQ